MPTYHLDPYLVLFFGKVSIEVINDIEPVVMSNSWWATQIIPGQRVTSNSVSCSSKTPRAGMTSQVVRCTWSFWAGNRFQTRRTLEQRVPARLQGMTLLARPSSAPGSTCRVTHVEVIMSDLEQRVSSDSVSCSCNTPKDDVTSQAVHCTGS